MAPLDWGLGHATRCIPLIRELITQGADVWLAASGAQATLLKEAFPTLPLLNLPGYQVDYAKTKRGLIFRLLLQVPRILNAIRQEHQWLKKAVDQYQFDAVISDNRFGLWHSKIPCIFITHQLRIQVPGSRFVEDRLQKINYRYINRFTACWVPDETQAPGLAGALSHPEKMPAANVSYIGPLSRFEKKEIPEQPDHLLVLLSGPEPQRTLLEEKILAELAHYHSTATLVRGLPGNSSMLPSTNMIRIFNHLPSESLNEELQKAHWVICRSGYSSVMDMAILGKKSIQIPTPGQTEQEYLASLYQQQQTAYTVTQEHFSLTAALTEAAQFNYRPFPVSGNNALSPVISRFLASLQ